MSDTQRQADAAERVAIEFWAWHMVQPPWARTELEGLSTHLVAALWTERKARRARLGLPDDTPPAANRDRKLRRQIEWPRLTYGAIGYFLGIGTVAAFAYHDWPITALCTLVAGLFWFGAAALDAPELPDDC